MARSRSVQPTNARVESDDADVSLPCDLLGTVRLIMSNVQKSEQIEKR